MRDIGARHLRWTHGDVRVEARVPLSFWSFGEIVKATISEAGSVQVESRCAWPLQVIDWGKNKRNCNDLLESIKVRIDRIA
ncbi:MAG: hypothetical protein GC159_22525 [Phycisphaera sp.]|nr:hypothetical protein [Phycisphaera sp.]